MPRPPEVYLPEQTLLTDMDGVVACFDERVQEILTERHPHIPIVRERPNFYIAQDYPEHEELVRAISREEGFFLSLELDEHAVEGLWRVIDAGFWPRICTSPIRTNPYSEGEKREWLQRKLVPHFGSWIAEQAIVSSNKHEWGAAALLDDRPEIESAHLASWQHIVHDRPYNSHVAGPRLRGWLDLELPNLLAAAQASYTGEPRTR